MKSMLLSFFVLLSLSEARASDTLTIRQVFNFSVGDTFDYAQTRINYDLNIHSTQYNRLVISQKQISPSQDSIIYNGHWVITNLDSIAVLEIDTVTNPAPSFDFFDTTSYIGRNSNDVTTSYFERGSSYIATEGLGETYSSSSSIANDGGRYNSNVTQLIYYSNGTTSFGTPYYIIAGLNDMRATPNIRLYPNPTTDQIHLSISDMNGSNYLLILTDILGQEVYTSSVNQSESAHDISNLSQGMYTWRLVGNNCIIKSGKIIKE